MDKKGLNCYIYLEPHLDTIFFARKKDVSDLPESFYLLDIESTSNKLAILRSTRHDIIFVYNWKTYLSIQIMNDVI